MNIDWLPPAAKVLGLGFLLLLSSNVVTAGSWYIVGAPAVVKARLRNQENVYDFKLPEERHRATAVYGRNAFSYVTTVETNPAFEASPQYEFGLPEQWDFEKAMLQCMTVDGELLSELPNDFELGPFADIVFDNLAAALGHPKAFTEKGERRRNHLKALIMHVLRTRSLPLFELEYAYQRHLSDLNGPAPTVPSPPLTGSPLDQLFHLLPNELLDRWYDADDLVKAINGVEWVRTARRSSKPLQAKDFSPIFAKESGYKVFRKKVFLPATRDDAPPTHAPEHAVRYGQLFVRRNAGPGATFDAARAAFSKASRPSAAAVAAPTAVAAAPTERAEPAAPACAGIAVCTGPNDEGLLELANIAARHAGSCSPTQTTSLFTNGASGFLAGSAKDDDVFCFMFATAGYKTFRAPGCDGSSAQCSDCDRLKFAFANRKTRALMKQGKRKASGGVPSKMMSHSAVAQDPDLSMRRLGEMSKKIKKQREQLGRLQDRLEEWQLMDVMDDAATVAMSRLVLAADDVLQNPSGRDGDEALCAMAEVHKSNNNIDAATVWNDLTKNAANVVKNNGNKGGVRYAVATVKFALATLNKVGTVAYAQLAEMYMLPSHRHLSKWRSASSGDGFGVMDTNIELARIEMEKNGDWSLGDRALAVCFDAMTVREDIVYKHKTGEFVGLASDSDDLGVIQREFARVATDNAGDAVEAARPGLRKAKHFQVYIASSVGVPKKEGGVSPMSFVCAQYSMASITGPLQRAQFGEVCDALETRGFAVICLTGDGASENRSAHKLSNGNTRGIAAKEFLTSKLTACCRALGIDTTYLVGIQLNGPLSHVMFRVSDAPHLWKKIVGALAQTSKLSNKARDLQYPIPEEEGGGWASLNLFICRDAWIHYAFGEEFTFETMYQGAAVRGMGLTVAMKLTLAHFAVDGFLAMRILSGTMVIILQQAEDTHSLNANKTATNPNGSGPRIPELKKLCFLVNRAIDIMNAHPGKGGLPGPVFTADEEKLVHLLELLSYFSKWRQALADDTTLSETDRSRMFVSNQLWDDLQSMVLGFVSLCCYYLPSDDDEFADPEYKYDSEFRGKLAYIMSRRVSSDKCEHHFAQVRGSAGSAPTIAEARTVTESGSGTKLATGGQKWFRSQRGNNAAAPTGGGGSRDGARPASFLTHKTKPSD